MVLETDSGTEISKSKNEVGCKFTSQYMVYQPLAGEGAILPVQEDLYPCLKNMATMVPWNSS